MFLRDGRIALFLSILITLVGSAVSCAQGNFAGFFAWTVASVGLVIITVIDRFDP